MKKDTTGNRNVLKAVYVISKIMALAPYTLHVRRSRLYVKPNTLACAYTCLSFLAVTASIWPTYKYHTRLAAVKTTDDMSIYFDAFRTGNNIAMSLVMYAIALWGRKTIGEALEEMHAVDDDFLRLNMVTDPTRTFKTVTTFTTVAYAAFAAVLCVDFAIFTQAADWLVYLQWVGYVYAYTVNVTGTCQFIAYLNLVFERYKLLNVYISSLITIHPNNITDTTAWLFKRNNRISDVVDTFDRRVKVINVTKSNSNKGKINVISQIHDKLCNVAKKLNSIYSLHILHTTSTTFIMLVTQLYFFYLMFSSNENYKVTYQKVWTAAIWGIIQTIDLFSLCYICTKTMEEASLSGTLIHKMNIDEDDELSRCYVEMFSMQMMHQKVEFTACGFFSMDFSIIYMIIGAVTTYLIFLIQFEMAGRTINQMTQTYAINRESSNASTTAIASNSK